MCTQFFISHEFFTLCKGENEKRLKGEKVGHGQTDRWKDGHLREKSIFCNYMQGRQKIYSMRADCL